MKAWSTLRKVANDRNYFVRKATIEGTKTPVFLLLDANMNVKMATRSQTQIQDAVYSL
jgi:hypothetical protein